MRVRPRTFCYLGYTIMQSNVSHTCGLLPPARLAVPFRGLDAEQPAQLLPQSREHFGFADGFAQPAVEGVTDDKAAGGGVPLPDGRWRALAVIALIVLSSACTTSGGGSPRPETTAYVNGHWYDGEQFVEQIVCVRRGTFTSPPCAEPFETFDLNGAYVVPAFGDGHHHTVLCDPERIQQFIKAGVLYAAIMNARVSSRVCQERQHGKGSVEVVSALAGFTERNAHPAQIGRFFLEENAIDGEWVHYVETTADIDSAWKRMRDTKPGFVKIFLSYSEDYWHLREDVTIEPWYRGLNPVLAAPIVEKAHREGLRVAAHVMSRHDFGVAVDAGVDIIAHMPGFAPDSAFTEPGESAYLTALTPGSLKYVIDTQSAIKAAAQGTVVVTTTSGYPNGESVDANMRTLRAAGVSLSDLIVERGTQLMRQSTSSGGGGCRRRKPCNPWR